jgi:regulator of protease activity HflC (stomatin/prohibitin superfamily)
MKARADSPAASIGRSLNVRGMGCAGIGIIVALAAILLFLAVNIVPAGHVGVVVTFGRVEPRVLPPGIYLRIPVAQTVVNGDTGTTVMLPSR